MSSQDGINIVLASQLTGYLLLLDIVFANGKRGGSSQSKNPWVLLYMLFALDLERALSWLFHTSNVIPGWNQCCVGFSIHWSLSWLMEERREQPSEESLTSSIILSLASDWETDLPRLSLVSNVIQRGNQYCVGFSAHWPLFWLMVRKQPREQSSKSMSSLCNWHQIGKILCLTFIYNVLPR